MADEGSKGMDLRKAIQWLSEQSGGNDWSYALIDEASIRFNLSPQDGEFLLQLRKKNKQQQQS
ncbi:MAG: hypothetical protein IK129_00280 [Deltaproteobacteria bacterium]|nr:hypothetical protein [Deltaproteobacteria bacterium]